MHEQLRASADEVAKYLKGITYPCNKKQLLDIAKRNQAPHAVLRTLEIVRDEKFDDVNDVKEAVKRVLEHK